MSLKEGGIIDIQLFIENNGQIQAPQVEGEITWTTERSGVPGSLKFNVVKSETLNFTEGNAVCLSVDGVNLFYGFIFTKKRSKDGMITVIAYDQLRYLKNKDTLQYKNKKASELIAVIAADCGLSIGDIEDTGHTIAEGEEPDTTYFDMILNALDETLIHTKTMHVLYDDYGKLTLKNIESMLTDVLITEQSASDYSYTSTIDDNTYNQVKLTFDNEETGLRDVYMAKDSNNINQWGLLQYYDTLQENEDGKAKADALLSLYNHKTRYLIVSKVFGNTGIRAGSSVAVQLNVGDLIINNYMMVEKCTHKFSQNEHYMDLTLRGGEFIA